ncbi:MAG: hypothetical protein U0556_06175 [Dehalococcoidia bacterium]
MPVIFVIVFAVYATSEIRSGADSRWTVFLAQSLLREGDFDLDEYRDIIAAQDFYFVESADGRLVSAYPVAISLLAAPFVALVDPLVGTVIPVSDRLLVRGDQLVARYWTIEALIASAWVALAAVFVYLAARERTTTTLAMTTTTAFAFGTSAWSSASRGLWGHAPSLLFISLAIWLLLIAPRRPALAGWAGLPLGMAVATRPQDWIAALVLALYVALRYRRSLPGYLLSLAIGVAPAIAYTFWLYGRPYAPYSSPLQLFTAGNALVAVAGVLISPSRGLFVYSPILVLSIVGLVWRVRGRTATLLDGAFAMIVLLHGLMIVSFVNWWGGHSFGPRLFTDILPFLMVFLADGLEALRRLPAAPRVTASAGVGLLLATSIFVHYLGANNYAVNFWSGEPVSVDVDRSRLWSIRDSQLLRWRPWIP